MKNLIIFSILALTTILFSCKKPEEDILPEVKIEVTSITQTAITLSVTAPNANQIKVCKDFDQCPLRNVEYGSLVITFSSLASNTVFSFQATAFFPQGEEKQSELIEVQTKALGSTLKAEQIKLHEAVLKGEISNQENLDYYFEYGTSASNLNESTDLQSGKGIVFAPVQNLAWGQVYFFRIVLIIDNQKFAGNTVSFRTLGDKPEIKDVQIISQDTLTMTLEFQLKSNLLSSQPSLRYHRTGGQWVNLSQNAINTDTNWVTLQFEVPSKTVCNYEFLLRVENDLGVCQADTNANSPAFMYDGYLYHWVQIGSQKWIDTDFRGKHYLNGDPIPYLADNSLWANTTSGAMCYWGNDEQNYIDYGALYNFYVIEDDRGIAPPGWKIPEEEDHDELMNFGVWIARKLKEVGFDYWLESNTGTNEFKFNARGSGKRGKYPDNSVFIYLKEVVYFHINKSYGNISAVFSLTCEDTGVLFGYNSKQYGQSIRFIKK
jgi:uncharacterized protein (TIGR02145 family)